MAEFSILVKRTHFLSFLADLCSGVEIIELALGK
jgi:hypothetical protein